MARARRAVRELRHRWGSYLLSTRWRYGQELKSHWKEYSLQSLLCVLVLFIAFMVLRFEHAVIIASIGATAFFVFSMPDSVTAKPRKVVGGHQVGLALGTVSTLVPPARPSIFGYRLFGGGRRHHVCNGGVGYRTPAGSRHRPGNRHQRLQL